MATITTTNATCLGAKNTNSFSHLNKLKSTTTPRNLHKLRNIFKQFIALMIMLTSTVFYNPTQAQFAGGSTGSTPPYIIDPLGLYLTPRSDVNPSGGPTIWGPADNLLNDGYNVVIQAPSLPSPPAGPIFNNDFRLSVFGERMVQVSGSGLIGTATGDRWNAIGDRLPFATVAGFSSNGLRSQWDGISANFGLSDDQTAGSTTRHGLIQWQDISVTSPGSTTNSRLRFVFRDGNAPAAGGLATEVGTALFDGKWGFGLNNIAPLSTVDVKGGVYVGSGTATVTAGTGDGYFSNSVRVGSDAFMSGASSSAGVVLDNTRRIGIGTNSPSEALDMQSGHGQIRIKMTNTTATAGALIDLTGFNLTIKNLESGGVIDFITNSGLNTRLRLTSTGDAIFDANVVPAAGGRNIGAPLPNTTWLDIYGFNAYTQTSDLNYKKNIKVIQYGLEAILNLRPVTYQWKNATIDEKIHLGFIAQEVFKVIPEVVVQGEESSMMMRYTDLIPVLVNAIKEQEDNFQKTKLIHQQQINELFDKIEKLELTRGQGNSGENPSILYRSDPNPFSTETTIKYLIGKSFRIAKILVIENNTGIIVKEFILQSNSGEVTLTSAVMNKHGLYSYALVLDNTVIETKQLLFESK